MASDTEPCGQHTIWEPQCRTCRRLAELTEMLREIAEHWGDRDGAGARRLKLDSVLAKLDGGTT
ncbi:MAG: hypothetical protein JXA90_09065 [Planctomycetes bacterium]|nr:hypothetical protein [Planctomycetota bacterium]